MHEFGPLRHVEDGTTGPVQPQATAHELGPRGMLALQRQAGNLAVTGLVRGTRRGAIGATALQMVRGEQDGHGPAVLQRETPPEADGGVDFTAQFNKFVGGYAFLAQRQVLAIDSIYTEAKKPKKPNLAEDLLIALATAALGSVISLVGSSIGRLVEGKLAARLADPSMSSNAVLKASFARAQEGAKTIGRSVNDAFKDGAKSFTGPRVRALIQAGKTPVDAFYEGQKDAVVLAAEAAKNQAEDMRKYTLALAAIDPRMPLLTATALAESLHEEFAHAYEVQQATTLEHWLSYQAQQKVGGKEWATNQGPQHATILHNVVERGDYSSGSSEVPGVLFVDAYVSPISDTVWTTFANGGRLAGLTQAMIASLSAPIRDLRLPVVYRVSSMRKHEGLGDPDLKQSLWPGPYAFNLGVNEVGATWTSKLYPWQREAMTKIGGEAKIFDQLGMSTLRSLNVQADRA